MQLDEFRRKKEAALARKAASAVSSPAKSMTGAQFLEDNDEAVRQLQATAATRLQEENDNLREQLSELIQGMDELHRALNDERVNSSQMESRVAELQEALAKAHHGEGVPGEEMEAGDNLVKELEETREAASRYAAAAETMSKELEESRGKNEDLLAELAAAQEAMDSIGLYKQRIDELEEILARRNDTVSTTSIQLGEDMDDQLEKNQKEIESLKDSLDETKGFVDQLQHDLNEKSSALEEAHSQAVSIQHAYEDQSQTLKDTTDALTALEEKFSDAEVRNGELTSELKNLAIEMDEKNRLLEAKVQLEDKYERQIADMSEKYEMEISDLRDKLSQKSEQENDLELLHKELSDEKEAHAVAERKLKQIEEELSQVQDELVRERETNMNFNQTESSLQEALQMAQAKLDELKSLGEEKEKQWQLNIETLEKTLQDQKESHIAVETELNGEIEALKADLKTMESDRLGVEQSLMAEIESLKLEQVHAENLAHGAEEMKCKVDELREELENERNRNMEAAESWKTEQEALNGQLDELNHKLTQRDEEIVKLLSKKSECDLEIEALEALMKEKESEISLHVEKNEILQKQLDDMEKSETGAATDLVAELKEYQSREEQLQQQLEESVAIAETENKQREALEIEFKDLNLKMERNNLEKQEAEAKAHQLEAVVQELRAQLGVLAETEQDAKLAKATAAEAISALESIQAENEMQITEIDGLERELDEMRLKLDATSQVEERCREAVSRCNQLEEEISSLTAEYSRRESDEDLKYQLSNALEKVLALESTTEELRQALQTSEERVQELQQDRDVAITSASNSNELKSKIETLTASLEANEKELQISKDKCRDLELKVTSQVAASSAHSELKQRSEAAEERVAELEQTLNAMQSKLETEQRRAVQLENFAAKERLGSTSSNLVDKKDEDNVFDPEAAALAGGTAFKPLVGTIRSLPMPFSHPVMTSAARELDKLMVALDVRPHIRLGIVVYFILLHILVLL